MSDSVLLDPTSESQPGLRPAAQRPSTFSGKTAALIDISKYRGDVFLDTIEGRLIEAGLSVKRYVKPTYAKPAPTSLQQEIAATADLAVVALAD
jgi:hypothetical protein